jgi:copper(I)-binding protein
MPSSRPFTAAGSASRFDRRSAAGAMALAASLALLFPAAACAETTVKDPWVRATVFQQKATGAFMEISASNGTRLISVSSPIAQQVEIHEMKMDGDVMRMASVPGLDLAAGVPVALKPGGFHIMMMGLKYPLQAGAEVPLTLTFQAKDGKQETVEVKAPVRALGFVPTPPDAAKP